MSSLSNRLGDALKDALRANDSLRKRTIRGVLASIKQLEIDSQTDANDMSISAVLQKEVKSHQESIADAETAGRDDLAAEMGDRIAILQEFMPKQLSRGEISELVKAVISEVGADSPRYMGEVMKRIMPNVSGQADGKLVSSIVSELLAETG